MQLLKPLKHLKKGQQSIDEYMKKVKSFFDQFVTLNNPISDESFINDTFEGLDSSFQSFIRAIEASNVPISYDELYALLFSEEAHLKLETMNLESSIQPLAYYGRQPPSHGSIYSWPKALQYLFLVSSSMIPYYNCNGTGHVLPQTPSPKYSRNSQSASNPATRSPPSV